MWRRRHLSPLSVSPGAPRSVPPDPARLWQRPLGLSAGQWGDTGFCGTLWSTSLAAAFKCRFISISPSHPYHSSGEPARLPSLTRRGGGDRCWGQLGWTPSLSEERFLGLSEVS